MSVPSQGLIGSTVDRYTFEGLLGTGGMAAVYLARHTQLGSRHAVKVLMLPSPAIQARLLQEGRAQSQLSHPNIVTVTDVIDVDGAPGLVMQYIPGPTLGQLLKNEVLELDQVDRLARGILRGVAAAHRAGLVHRDLKPGNILLHPTDQTLVPKITDFGLAKVLQPGPGGAFQTRSGVPMGTPSYMAPEQIRDAANVDARADVWALGCILFEMVTGHRAFQGADVVDTYRLVTDGTVVGVRSLAPSAPDRIVRAIEGSLRVDPEQRFSEVSALLETWRGGTDVSEAGTLDPALLDRARALVSAVDETPMVSGSAGPSWGSAGSDETWAATGMAFEASSGSLVEAPDSPAPAGSPSRWPWALAGALGLALVVGGGLIATRPAPEPVVMGFTVDAAPALLDDAVLQEELELGWQALRNVDFEQATRRLTVVIESEPDDPRIWLLHSRALALAGQGGASVDALWKAEQLATEGEAGPAGELAQLAGEARNLTFARRKGALLEWLERHPDDYLGHLVVLSMLPATETELAAQLFERARSLDPDVALTWWVESERALRHEDFDRAEQALRAGLAANPRTPTLLAGLGDVLLRRGQVEAANDALIEALEVAPGHGLARTRLAAASLMLGDDEAVRRITEQMTAPPTRWAHQARFAEYLSTVYVGLGRLEEGVGLLEHAGKEAARLDEWTTALVVYGAIPGIYMDADMVLPMVDSTKALMELSHQPEIPDGERETLVRNLLYAKGIGLVRTGKLDEAEEVVERLRALDRVWPLYLEWLERELAVARSQPERVLDLQKTTGAGCQGDLEKAHALYRAGGHPTLPGLLDARLSRPETCNQTGTVRFLLAVAHVTRAELAFQAGDLELARTHLEAHKALWPSPDRSVPAAERARSLEIRLASR